MMRVVLEVAEADAHVAMDAVRDGNRDAHAEDDVRQGQRIEVAVAEKEQAGQRSPHRRDRDEQWIGDVRGGEEHGGEKDGRRAAQAEAQQTQQNIDLQDELLHERPQRIAEQVRAERDDSVEGMQRLQVMREADSDERERRGGEDDPQRRDKTLQAESVGAGFTAAQECGDGDEREGDPVENALPGIRRPHDDQNEAIADEQLGQVAGAR